MKLIRILASVQKKRKIILNQTINFLSFQFFYFGKLETNQKKVQTSLGWILPFIIRDLISNPQHSSIRLTGSIG